MNDTPGRFAGRAQDRLRAVSAFLWHYEEQSVAARNHLKTNVYVDGFNLYYGSVKGTAYKWLNIAELCRYLLPRNYDIHRIRYFTAIVQPRPDDPQQADRQRIFVRALQTLPNLSVHYGQFLVTHPRMLLAHPPTGGPRTVEVVKTEEKGSDVNLATYLVADAYERDFDAAAVITDDSDLAEPIHLVRHRLGLHVTVLSPRGVSRRLSQVATRFRRVTTEALAHSQFPPTLTDAHGTINKPVGW